MKNSKRIPALSLALLLIVSIFNAVVTVHANSSPVSMHIVENVALSNNLNTKTISQIEGSNYFFEKTNAHTISMVQTMQEVSPFTSLLLLFQIVYSQPQLVLPRLKM